MNNMDDLHAKLIGITPPSPIPAKMGTSTNPKDRIGRTKPPLELIPPSAIYYESIAMDGRMPSAVGLIHESLAFKNGAIKYGPYNWRDEKVSAMVYLGAAQRHILDLFDREELAADSNVHHAAHAKACFGIFIDAFVTGNLVDDRPSKGALVRLMPTIGELEPVRTPVRARYLLAIAFACVQLLIDRGGDVEIASKARAALGLYLDAKETGLLEDDRPPKGNASVVIERFTEKKGNLDSATKYRNLQEGEVILETDEYQIRQHPETWVSRAGTWVVGREYSPEIHFLTRRKS